MRVAVPKLGCGIGDLDWQEVRKAILDTLEGVYCTVEIWE
jgi:O-acetyl-ADP-ribose deacetylase (regulator of RNase III)